VTSPGADQPGHQAEPQLIFPLVAEPSRRRVRVALAAGVVGLTLAVVLVTAATQLRSEPITARWLGPVEPGGTGPGPVGEPASVFDLEPGSCLADLGSGSNVSQVSVVPCDVDHLAEVVATARMPDGPWPGRQAVEEFATDHCVPMIYEGGIEVGDDLTWSYFGPTESSWSLRADRTVSCLVVKGGRA
jgi:hypothetical protein